MKIIELFEFIVENDLSPETEILVAYPSSNGAEIDGVSKFSLKANAVQLESSKFLQLFGRPKFPSWKKMKYSESLIAEVLMEIQVKLHYEGLKDKDANFTLCGETELPKFSFPCGFRNMIARKHIKACPGALDNIPHIAEDFTVEKIVRDELGKTEEWFLRT
jgi:hypothetical protein